MGILIPFERIAARMTEEDRKMTCNCIYCRNAGKNLGELQAGDVVLIEAVYTIFGDGGRFPLRIRYCPRCGRNIEVEIET